MRACGRGWERESDVSSHLVAGTHLSPALTVVPKCPGGSTNPLKGHVVADVTWFWAERAGSVYQSLPPAGVGALSPLALEAPAGRRPALRVLRPPLLRGAEFGPHCTVAGPRPGVGGGRVLDFARLSTSIHGSRPLPHPVFLAFPSASVFEDL